jgi:uncharacterized protein YndB with AHSA1/START domain
MSTVQVAIEIAAPIERVWETVMDPHQLQSWVTIHRSIAGVSGPPAVKGAKMDQVLVMRGVPFKVHWLLADVDPPRMARWEGRGPAHSSALIRYELDPLGDGLTRFSYTNEFHAPGGVLGNVASRVVVGHASEREANQSLAQLKRLLESR